MVHQWCEGQSGGLFVQRWMDWDTVSDELVLQLLPGGGGVQRGGEPPRLLLPLKPARRQVRVCGRRCSYSPRVYAQPANVRPARPPRHTVHRHTRTQSTRHQTSKEAKNCQEEIHFFI